MKIACKKKLLGRKLHELERTKQHGDTENNFLSQQFLNKKIFVLQFSKKIVQPIKKKL